MSASYRTILLSLPPNTVRHRFKQLANCFRHSRSLHCGEQSALLAASILSPAFATKSNRRFPTNFRSLPPFDIASAPLTYVAAHTARLATKVE
jgi:hypothetical protein